tara:strand:+ start:187 stop:453 length:267 start_codon:yes stop_codon:yes gene_type:complete
MEKEMSNKKSYMDKNNLITEGFFNKITKMFGLSTSQEKQLKKNKKVQNIIKDLNNDVAEFEKLASEAFEELGIDRKVDITRYKLKDFI